MLELRFYSELFSLILVGWATKLREWLFIKFGFHFTMDNEKKGFSHQIDSSLLGICSKTPHE
jgi:hypothetical protein